MKNYLAQKINISGYEIEGPLVIGGMTDFKLADIISILISFLILLAGVILFIVMILGGYEFMMSQGQPDKMKGAQAKITAGIIGFILLIFSYVIAKLLAAIFGLDQGIL